MYSGTRTVHNMHSCKVGTSTNKKRASTRSHHTRTESSTQDLLTHNARARACTHLLPAAQDDSKEFGVSPCPLRSLHHAARRHHSDDDVLPNAKRHPKRVEDGGLRELCNSLLHAQMPSPPRRQCVHAQLRPPEHSCALQRYAATRCDNRTRSLCRPGPRAQPRALHAHSVPGYLRPLSWCASTHG